MKTIKSACQLQPKALEINVGDQIEQLDQIITERVATVFPRVTRRFFENRGCRVEIVPVSGAAEIAPHLGIADIVVDLTSTGSTLKMNGLREVATVLESTARLVTRVANGDRLDPGKRRALDDLADALARHLEDATDLFERVRVPVADAVAQLDDLPLAVRQALEHLLDALLEHLLGRCAGR